MEIITQQEKNDLINDLIAYYRFCKRDTRNHIFNAIAFKKKYNNGASQEELNQIKISYENSKERYGYLLTKISEVVCLKIDSNLVSLEKKEHMINALLMHYEIYVKGKYYRVRDSARRLLIARKKENYPQEQLDRLNKEFLEDKFVYKKYKKRYSIAKILKQQLSNQKEGE